MEIKQNTYTMGNDPTYIKFKEKMIADLEKNGYTVVYQAEGLPLPMAEKLGGEFKKAGYYGKIVYFVDGRASYQSIIFSKSPVEPSTARMVYSVEL